MVAMSFETISRRTPPRKPPLFTLERVISIAFAATFMGVGAFVAIIGKLH
jgi:hypothetical protein